MRWRPFGDTDDVARVADFEFPSAVCRLSAVQLRGVVACVCVLESKTSNEGGLKGARLG